MGQRGKVRQEEHFRSRMKTWEVQFGECSSSWACTSTCQHIGTSAAASLLLIDIGPAWVCSTSQVQQEL